MKLPMTEAKPAAHVRVGTRQLTPAGAAQRRGSIEFPIFQRLRPRKTAPDVSAFLDCSVCKTERSAGPGSGPSAVGTKRDRLAQQAKNSPLSRDPPFLVQVGSANRPGSAFPLLPTFGRAPSHSSVPVFPAPPGMYKYPGPHVIAGEVQNAGAWKQKNSGGGGKHGGSVSGGYKRLFGKLSASPLSHDDMEPFSIHPPSSPSLLIRV